MRNSQEITRKYQFGYMLLRNLLAVFIAFVFEAVAAYSFLANPVGRYIVASIFTIVYGAILYSAASKLAGYDRKTYTPLNSELKWGIMWGIMLAVIMLLLAVMYIINNRFFAGVEGSGAIVSWFINVLFYLLTAPFFGFIIVNPGTVHIYVLIIMAIVPIAACTIGYMAGASNFDLVSKLDSLTFEKEEDEDE